MCKLRAFNCKGIVACAGFRGVTLSDRYENQTAKPVQATGSIRESRRACVDDMISLSSSQANSAIRTFVCDVYSDKFVSNVCVCSCSVINVK